MANPSYLRMVQAFTGELLRADRDPCDLTSAALGAGQGQGSACMMANEAGVLAGLAEAVWFFTKYGVAAEPHAADGDELKPGQGFLRLQGDCGLLLSLERVGLNLLQRMSGIATATHRLQAIVHARSPQTQVVVTRKTPWGLLDKRAAHLGGGGTHRIGLGDAVLIKTNHLRLFAPQEEDAIPLALRKAWARRAEAAFIEVEVTSLEGALVAGRVFHELRQDDADSYPCLIMLDNMAAGGVGQVISTLRAGGVWDGILVEVSGGISEGSLEAFADCGVDAISVGALTHSCKALDLRSKLEVGAGKRAQA
jgi:nicotinate-nucleotide pyrophosphorylase (carboxylating)